ncbi:MAG: RimK family alpha-L-glutamate ligase, partial [Bacteroidota bacterium]
TPKTELVHEHTNLEQLFKQEFRFPVVLKLAESTHGLGVFLVHNKRELRRMLRSNRHIRPLLLQEFIREAAGCDIRAFVIGEQVVASMKRSATSGDFRANLHRGGRAKSIQLSTVQANLVVKTAKVLDIPIAGIDLLMSARGLLVIEANASPGLEGIERVSGRNIARGILRYVSSK